MHARLSWSIVLAAVGLAGCVSGPHGSDAIVPAPAEAALAAGRAGMPPADIARAAEIYVLKCARCHKFYDPAGYSAADWSKWMAKMSRKSRLQPVEESLLGRYLDASRSTDGVVQ